MRWCDHLWCSIDRSGRIAKIVPVIPGVTKIIPIVPEVSEVIPVVPERKIAPRDLERLASAFTQRRGGERIHQLFGARNSRRQVGSVCSLVEPSPQRGCGE